MEIHHYTEENSFWIGTFSDEQMKFQDISQNVSGVDYFLYLRSKLEEKYTVSVQIFNSEWIISLNQIKRILLHVEKAFQTKSNISKHPGMEFLLYLSLKRQIGEAIDLVGVDFSQSLQKNIKFVWIIFGNTSSIKQSVDDLNQRINFNFEMNLNQYDKQKILQNSLINYKIKDKIIIDQIQLQLDKFPIITDTNDKPISISHFDTDLLLPIIEDIVNEKMVLFYINNFRG